MEKTFKTAIVIDILRDNLFQRHTNFFMPSELDITLLLLR